MIIIQTVNKFHRFIERRQTDMKLTGKQFRDQILKLIGNEQPLAWAKKHKIKKEVMDTILRGSISDLPDLFKLSRALRTTIDELLTGMKLDKCYSAEEQEYIDKVVSVLRSKHEASKASLKDAIKVYYCLICE
jgi:hypothetical protein